MEPKGGPKMKAVWCDQTTTHPNSPEGMPQIKLDLIAHQWAYDTHGMEF